MATENLATAEQLNGFLADLNSAPVSDRGFFVCDKTTYEKHAELSVLLDPTTGLPFPLAPTNRLLPIHNGNVANWHHGIHPRTSPVLQTLGGRAMRSAQIQLVAANQHNHGKNAFHNMEVGPYIHRDVGHQIGMCLMAAAAAEHRMAMYTKNDQLWLRPLTPLQQRQLTIKAELTRVSPTEIAIFHRKKRPDLSREEVEELLNQRNERQAEFRRRNIRYDYDAIRTFLARAVLDQNLGNVKRKALLEYAYTGSEQKGLALIGVAAKELARTTVTYNGQTLADLYKDMYIAGKLAHNMPMTAGALINHKLGDVQERLKLLPTLREKVSEQLAA